MARWYGLRCKPVWSRHGSRTPERAAVTYAHLRGLLLVPVGALFLLAALANWDVVPTWALAAGVAVIALLWLVIRREYGTRYGSVRTSPRQQTRDALPLVLACAIVVGVSVLLRDLPVNAIAIGFAVAMALGYALGPGLRPHHVAILGACSSPARCPSGTARTPRTPACSWPGSRSR